LGNSTESKQPGSNSTDSKQPAGNSTESKQPAGNSAETEGNSTETAGTATEPEEPQEREETKELTDKAKEPEGKSKQPAGNSKEAEELEESKQPTGNSSESKLPLGNSTESAGTATEPDEPQEREETKEPNEHKKHKERKEPTEHPVPVNASQVHYLRIGKGYCLDGYYDGWDRTDAMDLATCARKCTSEPQCKFFALKVNVTCSRYNVSAGLCTLFADDPNACRHTAYAKQVDGLPIPDRIEGNAAEAEGEMNSTEASAGASLPLPLRSGALFCWLLARAKSYEAELVRLSFQHGQGVFRCDVHSVLSDYAFWVGPGVRPIEIGNVTSPPALWGSVMNAKPFVRAWDTVIRAQHYWNCGWVVKVDPDTVFFPERLSQHLAEMPAHTPFWVRNWDYKFGMLGCIEILSVPALQLYAKRKRECLAGNISAEGEDGWLAFCLNDILGVPSQLDTGVLDYAGELNACVWRRDVPAFHPFKDPAMFTQCLDSSTGGGSCR